MDVLRHIDVSDFLRTLMIEASRCKLSAARSKDMIKNSFCRRAGFGVLVVAIWGTRAFAQDAGISQLLPICEACHGHDGQSSMPTTPIIAGIDAGIIADAIYARQDGDPPCPTSPMCAIVEGISRDQAEALGKYFSAKQFMPAKQSFDKDKAARGAEIHAAQCEQCHSKGGSDPEDQTSILAGQWMPYLSATLNDYAAGKREALEPMRKRLQMMTPEDLDALANFYASEGP
jgi:sulfide dehydrogenase cytochrome subunit